MTHRFRSPRWAFGLALAGACALAAVAQVREAAPVAEAPAPSSTTSRSPRPMPPPSPCASAPDAWGGPRTGDEATLSDRVVTYRIEATLDPKKHTVAGKQQLTWRNRSNVPVKSVYLHLYLNAFEGPGSTFNTEQRNNHFGFRSEVKVDEGGFGYIRLQRVAAGRREGAVALRAARRRPEDRSHRGAPGPARSGRAGRQHHARHRLLRPAAARERAHRLLRHVPSRRRSGSRRSACSNCRANAVPPRRAGTRTSSTCTASSTPTSACTTCRSPCRRATPSARPARRQGKPVERNGQVTHRFVQGDVHDFAWTADNRYAKPLDGVYNGANGPVKVRVLYHPEYAPTRSRC